MFGQILFFETEVALGASLPDVVILRIITTRSAGKHLFRFNVIQ